MLKKNNKNKDKIVLNEKILNFLCNECGLHEEIKDWWLKTIGNDFPINELENIDGDIKGYISILKKIIDNTEFDRKSNIKTYTDSDGISITFEYDKNNNLIAMEDTNGYSCTYEYDENNNKIRFKNSNGYYEAYEYDKNNNLIKMKDSKGIDETYKYKKLFNEIKIKLFSKGELQNQCSIPISYRKIDLDSSIEEAIKNKPERLNDFSYPIFI